MDDIIFPPDDDGNLEPDEPPNVEAALNAFRSEWHHELHNQKQQQSSSGQQMLDHEEPSVEDEAKYLFIQGVQAEQRGKLYEAIGFYRRAVQLVPDIEFRIDYMNLRVNRNRQESESSVDSSGAPVEEEEDLVNLVQHFQRLRTTDPSRRTTCLPETEPRGTHISALPIELLMYIFKWVVSNDVDTLSLENLALVCRGFYLCARDEELWRLICRRIWGVNCGRAKKYGSWRDMFLQRPRLRYNGIYISKMSYYREGEKSLDNFYKPYHHVEYYRYMRFFPEGRMWMLTTPEDPYSLIPQLRQRSCKVQGMLTGYYKLTGSQVQGIMKRIKVVDPQRSLSSYYRYKRQRQQQQPQDDAEQTFHVDLNLMANGKNAYSQLMWNGYSIHTKYRLSGEENIAEFELNNNMYPPLLFSRVRSFTAECTAPLQ